MLQSQISEGTVSLKYVTLLRYFPLFHDVTSCFLLYTNWNVRRRAINVRRRAKKNRPPKQHEFSCLSSNSLQIANCAVSKFSQILHIYYFEKGKPLEKVKPHLYSGNLC